MSSRQAGGTVRLVDSVGSPPRHLSPRQWVWVDAALATAAFIGAVASVVFGHPKGPGPAWDSVRYLAAALVAGAVPFRRSRPVAAVAVVLAGLLLAASVGLGGPV